MSNRSNSLTDQSVQDQVNAIIPNVVGDFIDVVNDSTKPQGTIATTTGLRATLVYNGTSWVSTRTGLPAYPDTYSWLDDNNNIVQNQYHYWYCFRAEDHILAPSTSGNFARVAGRNYRQVGNPFPFFTVLHNAPTSCNWITGTVDTALIAVGTGGKKYLDVPGTGVEFDLGTGFEIGEAKMIMRYGTNPGDAERYSGFSAYFVVKDIAQQFDFGRIVSFDSQSKVGYVGDDFTNNDAFITNFAGTSRDVSLVQRATQIKCGTIAVGALCVFGFSYHSDSKTLKTYVCSYDPTLQLPITKFTGCSFADNGSPDTLKYIRFGSYNGSAAPASMKLYEFVLTAFYDETPDRMMTGLYEHYKTEA